MEECEGGIAISLSKIFKKVRLEMDVRKCLVFTIIVLLLFPIFIAARPGDTDPITTAKEDKIYFTTADKTTSTAIVTKYDTSYSDRTNTYLSVTVSSTERKISVSDPINSVGATLYLPVKDVENKLGSPPYGMNDKRYDPEIVSKGNKFYYVFEIPHFSEVVITDWLSPNHVSRRLATFNIDGAIEGDLSDGLVYLLINDTVASDITDGGDDYNDIRFFSENRDNVVEEVYYDCVKSDMVRGVDSSNWQGYLNLPYVKDTADTTFYVYYDTIGDDDYEDEINTYPSGVLVHHFENAEAVATVGPDGTLYESGVGITSATGLVGNGISGFDTNNYVIIGTMVYPVVDFTMVLLCSGGTGTSGTRTFLYSDNGGIMVTMASGSYNPSYSYYSTLKRYTATHSGSSGWNYHLFTSSIYAYSTTVSNVTIGTGITTGSHTLYVGRGPSTANPLLTTSVVDELLIYNEVKTKEWWLSYYYSVSAQGTYISWGSAGDYCEFAFDSPTATTYTGPTSIDVNISITNNSGVVFSSLDLYYVKDGVDYTIKNGITSSDSDVLTWESNSSIVFRWDNTNNWPVSSIDDIKIKAVLSDNSYDFPSIESDEFDIDFDDSPSIPALSSPFIWATGQDTNLDFNWSDSTDVESDPFTYTLIIETDIPYNQVISKTGISSSAYSTDDLDLMDCTLYRWKVKSVQTDTNATLGYSPYYYFQTSCGSSEGGTGGTGASVTSAKVVGAYDKASDRVELMAWYEEGGVAKTGISSVTITVRDDTNATVHTSTTGTVFADGVYRATWSPGGTLHGLYSLKVQLTYDGTGYSGIGYFDAGFMEVQDTLGTIITSLNTIAGYTDSLEANVNASYVLIGGIKAKTDTINWSDITEIKAKTDTINWAEVTAINAKTDTINWADITYIYTTSGEIKAKTDTIAWSDISAIKTKTDTINWADVTAIKAITDTIDWTDITSIQSDLTTLKGYTDSLEGDMTTIKGYIGTPTDLSSANTLFGYGQYLKEKWGTYSATSIYNKINDTYTLAGTIDGKVDSIQTDVTSLQVMLSGVDVNVSAVAALAAGIDANVTSVMTDIATLDTKIDALTTSVAGLTPGGSAVTMLEYYITDDSPKDFLTYTVPNEFFFYIAFIATILVMGFAFWRNSSVVVTGFMGVLLFGAVQKFSVPIQKLTWSERLTAPLTNITLFGHIVPSWVFLLGIIPIGYGVAWAMKEKTRKRDQTLALASVFALIFIIVWLVIV